MVDRDWRRDDGGGPDPGALLIREPWQLYSHARRAGRRRGQLSRLYRAIALPDRTGLSAGADLRSASPSLASGSARSRSCPGCRADRHGGLAHRLRLARRPVAGAAGAAQPAAQATPAGYGPSPDGLIADARGRPITPRTSWTMPGRRSIGRSGGRCARGASGGSSAGYFGGAVFLVRRPGPSDEISDRGRLQADEAAWALGLVSLVAVPGQIALGHLSDRIGREWVWMIGNLGFVICYLCLHRCFASAPTPLLLYADGRRAGHARIQPHLGDGSDPRRDLRRAALREHLRHADAGGDPGGAAGPWVTGVIYDATGSYSAAWWIAIGFSLMSILAIWIAAPGKVRAVAGRAERLAADRIIALKCQVITGLLNRTYQAVAGTAPSQAQATHAKERGLSGRLRRTLVACALETSPVWPLTSWLRVGRPSFRLRVVPVDIGAGELHTNSARCPAQH